MKKLDLNTSAPLPSGSSTQGATDSSMGGASMADLERGFCDSEAQDSGFPEDAAEDAAENASKVKPGFLGRPQGWER